MAEAVVSFVVQKLGDLLIEEVASFYDVQGQVESIERELTRMQCFLKDADVKQKGDERIKNWVGDIRDVAFDVEDIIDTFVLKLACQRRRSGLRGFIGRFKYCFSDLAARRQLAEDIERTKRRISEISISRATYGLKTLEGIRLFVCVRNCESEDDPLPVLMIMMLLASMKTLTYYRARELLHELGRRVLSIDKDGLAAMNKDDLEEKLYKALSKKRYLIVLDDIWKIEAWDDLKAIFPDVMNGSKLLFTTRIKEVAVHADPMSPLHELHFLSDAESWQLFTKKAFQCWWKMIHLLVLQNWRD
ncbi:hypothetical protein GH714_031715 [Hevea brasiliensis]|uniref:Rx N-terminal domain-containing protein n=1 Tax=Hevea brasiliensis TaxID=3981 RepID=A0A6A6M576_HEVBR|nr:hypothetical protein GH714_031715 [Hevea brasiliensis]